MHHVVAGGADIPALGVGTFQLSEADCERAVRSALELGYRHVDTAEFYDNERAVGAAIADAPVDREEVFLTTKVWRTNLRREDVRQAVLGSLGRLGVEYVDLLLIHWPHPRVPVAEPLDAMATLSEEGLVRHVGVSNFTRSQLKEAVSVADVPIVTDQVLYNPFVDRSALRAYCAAEDVALTAYSPLATGAVVGNDVLERIGARHGKTAAQVALRWLVQQEGVVAIPRAINPHYLAENLAVFDFELTDGEVARIDELTGGLRVRMQTLLPSLIRMLPL